MLWCASVSATAGAFLRRIATYVPTKSSTKTCTTGGGGGATRRFWTPTIPPTDRWPEAPLGGGGGGLWEGEGGALGGGGSGGLLPGDEDQDISPTGKGPIHIAQGAPTHTKWAPEEPSAAPRLARSGAPSGEYTDTCGSGACGPWGAFWLLAGGPLGRGWGGGRGSSHPGTRGVAPPCGSPCQENHPADAHPSAHKSVRESANPRMASECASGCTWSTARATARLRDSRPPGVVKQDTSSGGSVDTEGASRAVRARGATVARLT